MRKTFLFLELLLALVSTQPASAAINIDDPLTNDSGKNKSGI